MKSSCVVLLSSGLDSTVNLAWALKEHSIAAALTFDYGQWAAPAEIKQSRKICNHYGVPHQVIELPWLQKITKSSLVNTDQDVPVGQSVSIDNLEKSLVTAKAVWVPNRNGVFFNIGASFAESLSAKWVVSGFNIEEAATFPDNTQDFLNALDVSFQYSTQFQVKTLCGTTSLNKTEIVALGRKLGAPLELVWPCYFSGETLCGTCESCQRYLRAMEV